MFLQPPIVETETVVVEPVEDDEPELTNEVVEFCPAGFIGN